MFWIPIKTHDCSPLPIEEIKVSYDYNHSMDQAGYDIIKVEQKLSQCPVCKNKYTYDKPTKTPNGFMSYKEFMEKK